MGRRKWLPSQCERGVPSEEVAEAESGAYDLVCIGSPTWLLTTCMPIRSFLESDESARLLAGQPVAAFVVCRRYAEPTS